MKPVQHPSNNGVLAPPAGFSTDECRALPITRVKYHPGDIPGVVSYWLPSADELLLLNSGRPVYLSCMGATIPPVAIGVDGDGNL